MKTFQKILKIIVLIAIYYPLVNLILLYSFVLRATLALGRLPEYNNPDPKDLGFTQHHDIVMKSSHYLPHCFFIIISYGIICLIMKKNMLKINMKHFMMFLLFVMMEIISLFTYTGWFVDQSVKNIKTLQKILRIIVFIAIYYPLINLLLFYSFVLRATIALGRFPEYNNPDPKDLGFTQHYNVVYEYDLLLIPYSVLIVLAYALICYIKKENILQISIKHFIMYAIFFILEIITLFTFGGWFID